MKRTSKPFHLVTTVTLLSCILLSYSPIQAQEDRDLDNKIKSLINDLSAPEYSVRESAKEKLLNIGEPAIKHLEEAIKSEEDIELIEGAEEVLEKIKEKISPKRQQVNRNHDGGTLTFKGETFTFKMNHNNIIDREIVTIEETEDNFTLLTATKDNVTKKYQAKSKEEFMEKFPEVYKQYKNIIDGPGVTIEETEDNFTLKVTKDYVTKEYQAKSKEEFMEKFPELYKQYKNIIDGEAPSLIIMLTDQFLPFRHVKQDDDGDQTEKWNVPDNNDNNSVQIETTPKAPEERKLGLSLDVLTEDEAEKRGLEFGTIYIKKIDKDSLLYKEGLREGDAIVEINDSRVNTTYLVRKKLVELLEKNGGKIVINRGGEFKELRVKFDTY